MTSPPADLRVALSLSADLRIDAACLQFEAAWKAGHQPCPEDFLAESVGPERLVLLRELILIDVDYRRRTGENPSPRDYLHRFAELMPDGPGVADLTEEQAGRLLGFPISGGIASFSAPGPGNVPSWPTRFGGYRLVRQLECVGVGYAFEAEHEESSQRVVVRVFLPDLARKPDAVTRFLREARAAAVVEHENVVPILDVGEEVGMDDGVLLYAIAPLLKGESLDKRLIREGKLSTSEIVQVGRDVAAGLTAIHRNGLVHRNVKPGNVWLDADTGRARLLDFGLVRLTDGGNTLTDSRAMVDHPAYAAPEQLNGQPVTPRSDLFSLGATLYECATGQKAFAGKTLMAVLGAVCDRHPPPPAEVNPDVPLPLSSLIVRMLAKNPVDRPTSAAEVLAGLVPDSFSMASGDGTPTTQPVVTSELRSMRSRGWWFLVAAIATFIAVWLASRA